MESEAFKILSVFIEEELDELIKLPSTLDFERLKGVKTAESKLGHYTNVNYTQLKTFLADTKLLTKLKRLGKSITVPSTRGYNNFYLNFLEETFNINIRKTQSFFSYAILAIDFLNKNTVNCFFDLPGHDISLLNFVGESKLL